MNKDLTCLRCRDGHFLRLQRYGAMTPRGLSFRVIILSFRERYRKERKRNSQKTLSLGVYAKNIQKSTVYSFLLHCAKY